MSKKNILQQLFDGELCPAEKICVGKSEYYKLNDALNDEKDRLLKLIPGNNNDTFDKMDDLHNSLCNMFSYEGFASGYRVGIMLLFEALKGEDNSTQVSDK